MAIDVPGGILKQSDVRETITNTEETGVLFNLAFNRFEGLHDTSQGITGCHISPDGINIYILYDDAGTKKVGQWTFGTKYDITTITETRTLNIDAVDTEMTSLFFKPDGLMMFTVGTTSDKVYAFVLTTAWDISTATPTDSFTFAGNMQPVGLYFREDGRRMFHGTFNSATVFWYDLSTPWDVTTSVKIGDEAVNGIIYDIYFSRDGLTFIMVGNDEFIDTYTLTAPFNPSTKGAVTTHTIGPTKNLRGITFKTNGSIMYVGAADGQELLQYLIKRGWR